ncbi:MAG: T9SS type A sorting domain-containing protein [Ignavibacteriaceae bacterium]|nr:T9SS type A sorting domain-containing protein [Ignavibacteriaceae bacterium]
MIILFITTELFQNYPNPYNPTTKISYQLSVDVPVTLQVYDLLGREVATLVNEEKQTGNYEVQFDASNLSSGVYLYKITMNDFTKTMKMMVVK